MADATDPIELFLRNALKVKGVEDRAVRGALRQLRQVLSGVAKSTEQSGLLQPGPGREFLLRQYVAAVANSVRETWGVTILGSLQEELLPFFRQQLDFARSMVEAAGGTLTVPGAAAMAPEAVARVVSQTVVRGKTLGDVLAVQLPVQIADRVESYIRLGVAGLGGDVVATFQDAVVKVTERTVEATIRTAVHEVGSAAQQAVYELEADPDWGEGMLVWTAVLDSRVCPVCVALDGKEFPNTYRKVSPHFNCRCYLLPKKWRRDRITQPDGTTNDTLRPVEGDRGEGELSFRKSAKQWVKDNPETAKEIFGKRLGQQLADGEIGFDKALKLWQQPKGAS